MAINTCQVEIYLDLEGSGKVMVSVPSYTGRGVPYPMMHWAWTIMHWDQTPLRPAQTCSEFRPERPHPPPLDQNPPGVSKYAEVCLLLEDVLVGSVTWNGIDHSVLSSEGLLVLKYQLLVEYKDRGTFYKTR